MWEYESFQHLLVEQFCKLAYNHTTLGFFEHLKFNDYKGWALFWKHLWNYGTREQQAIIVNYLLTNKI